MAGGQHFASDGMQSKRLRRSRLRAFAFLFILVLLLDAVHETQTSSPPPHLQRPSPLEVRFQGLTLSHDDVVGLQQPR